MTIKRYIGYTMMAAGLLAASSCTDFNDYNEAVQDATPQGNKTLWQNISENSQLSQFKSLVEKAGFASELDASHYRTVWAPADGTFDYASLSALSPEALQKQFVYNHIAEYAHNATGVLSEKDETTSRVKMLNSKVYSFLGSAGNYTFDGVNISSPNQPSSNGVMHILSGPAAYHPNLYELLTDSLLNEGLGIDTVTGLVKHYENTYLDESKSVVGPIVNGRQTYIDSVMVTTNDLSDLLNVKFENEDSSYTMLIPTNDAWKKMVERIKPNYNYVASTKGKVWQTSNGVQVMSERTVRLADPVAESDTVAMLDILTSLFYSNNNLYNQWLNGRPSYLGSDTLRTTTGMKYTNPQELLNAKSSEIALSNGKAYVVDSLPIRPWELYSPKLTMSATGFVATMSLGVESPQSVSLGNVPDSILEGIDTRNLKALNYLYVQPSAPDNLPTATFYLPSVLSTTYDIYCVFMPTCLDDTINTAKPNLLKFTLSYFDEKGAEQTIAFKTSEGKDSFRIEPYHIDSLYLGTVNFPVCYAGLTDNNLPICPNITVASGFSRLEWYDRAAGIRKRDYYAHGYRIASFVLKPKELVEHENLYKQDEQE